jgi:hypothetical protein
VVREFDMPADCESVFAVSPVDEIAAVVSDNSVVLLDLLTGQPNKVLRPGEGHEVGGPMFSPNGAYLVGDTASEFHIWDVDTGVKLYTIKGRLPSAPRLAFSHTGNLFLPFAEKSTTEGTSTFTLYEAATGLPVQTLAIPGLSRGWDCFSPNPAKILTLTLKPPIRMPTLKDYSSNVWNLRTGAEERFTYQRWGVRWLCDIAPDGRHILSAGFAPITVWQTPQEMGRGQKAQVKLTREALTTNWEKLDANPELAFEAMFALAGGGESTVEFIRETVTPAKAVNAGEINQLIGTLESEEFLRREAAQDKLLLLKPHAERRLRAVLGESPSAELRARVEELLRAPRDVVRENSDEIAQIRAIQMLEWIGSDTARDVLKALAAGDPSHRQTLYAKQGIQRLQRSESVMK